MTLRDDYTTEQRTLEPYHHIDPGFINWRLCFSTLGTPLREAFDKHRYHGEDHFTKLHNNHVIVDIVLSACKSMKVASLGQALAREQQGLLWSSTEKFEGNERVYDDPRVRNRILLPYSYDRECYLEFHTKHITCDTGMLEHSQESVISVVAGVHRITDAEVECRPLIMGAPSYDHPWNKDIPLDFMWHGWDWYEIFPEDIGEFVNMKHVPCDSSAWMQVMKHIPEEKVKQYFCEIIGDASKKDWGGELDDHFSASLHVGDQRTTAAFLLKGPAQFREMTPDMLGKRADQIFRLSCTPAKLLVVQHSHQIAEAVRATLRAFAVTPHNPRRYCLVDGKDTYRILKAYGKI